LERGDEAITGGRSEVAPRRSGRRRAKRTSQPLLKIEPGGSTAFPFNVQYRFGRVSKYIQGGRWLDYGCADGGYTEHLRLTGAAAVEGVDVDGERIEAARSAHPEISFHVAEEGRLPFPDDSFDGVFMNEVFEHVADEHEALEEVHRVLKPGGWLILISPNRGFPFEGHGVHIGGWSSQRPIPLIPWLPRSLTDRWVTARNYWPRELRDTVSSSGFSVIETGFVMPVFENYPWVPAAVVKAFRRHISFIDRCPVIRRAGVSNLVVALREI
jgi:ubiquinone/menaquinone biosynthesis C-methylase UbiE